MHRLELTKTEIYLKNHLLLQILAVISRHGSHLMIVMLFVTQNNFLNGPGISVSLDYIFYQNNKVGEGSKIKNCCNNGNYN